MSRSPCKGNHFTSIETKISMRVVQQCVRFARYARSLSINIVIGERSEPLSRVFNDKPRDLYGGVRT